MSNYHRISRAPFALGAIALLFASVMVPSGLAAETTTTTTNSTPAIGAVYFYTTDPTSGSGAACAAAGRVTSFNPAAGADRAIYVCVEASDANGYNDICDTGAASTSDVRTFNATNSAGGSISDANNPKNDVALACATGSGTSVALIGSVQMEYWRSYGLAAAANAYLLTPRILDIVGAAATGSGGSFDYTNLTSLDASSVTTVSMGGALAPAATGTETSASIYNKGNTAFTLFVSGTNLTGASRAQTIGVANLKWATSASVVYGTKTALGASSASTSLSAPAETVDGTTARAVYFQLGVPSGTAQWIPSDTYAGAVTFATG
ncbi:MAG: hypothetical protein WDA16_14960 [Candidatus Thermoplasmatota archaeon]